MSRHRHIIICRDSLTRSARILSNAITDRAAWWLIARSNEACDRVAHDVRNCRRLLVGLAGPDAWPQDDEVRQLTLLDCLNRITAAQERAAVAAEGIALGGACTAQLSEAIALLHGVPHCLTGGRL